MKTIKTIEEMQLTQDELHKQQRSIGFVPTMGYLHDGHLALIKEARKENDIVVVSIFVNPLQFNQASDLDQYPRDLERDEKLLIEEAVDYVFYPSNDAMYPKPLSVDLSLNQRGDVLCGTTRPGHFEGVLMVLTKLFNIVNPNRVYFGLKDAQQVAVVDGLINDFNFNIELVPVPTVREVDGVAMSSRNVNLSTDERQEAHHIYMSLLKGQQLIQASNWTRQDVIDEIDNFLKHTLSGQVDYVDCLTYPELTREITEKHDIIIAVAVKYQNARLIDNIILTPSGDVKYRSEA
ncbi:pantoate--beta-alanine ligase [Alkalibacillus haloalkaliphilus]|uniref:pantoate--beta-alanine ligase n=1 Tax=Alkalibacillus haloalkaliphilus TaxID=94136 RepID=UPI0029355CB3|nr:pantoate--beta-alanine ligase [Alkalibacillus haloalkaliphilus]MDV2580807.1 pantoate--beta-alanine ligase [Alkalibacillus haloalkaliphilus]